MIASERGRSRRPRRGVDRIERRIADRRRLRPVERLSAGLASLRAHDLHRPALRAEGQDGGDLVEALPS